MPNKWTITKCRLNIQMFLSADSLVLLTGTLFFHSLFIHWLALGSHIAYSSKVKMLFHLRPVVISTNIGMFTSFHVCFPYYCTMLPFFFHLERSFPNKIPEDFWNIQYLCIHTQKKVFYFYPFLLWIFSQFQLCPDLFLFSFMKFCQKK